jgi:hypothetical protein
VVDKERVDNAKAVIDIHVAHYVVRGIAELD